MEGVPYGFWLKYLNSIFGHYDHDPFEVLDLACGTGTLTLMLVHEGLVVGNVDAGLRLWRQVLTSGTYSFQRQLGCQVS